MKNFDRIEDYLFERMTADDRRALEAEAEKDGGLAAELAAQRLEHRAMELASRRAFRAKMADWQAEKAATETTESRKAAPFFVVHRRVFQYAAAASVALAIGFFWLFSGPSGGDAANDFFDRTSYATTERGGDGDPLAAALAAMTAKKWAEAEAALRIAPPDPRSETLLGECLFRQKKWAEAEAVYQKMAATGDSAFKKAEGEWFLALVYLASEGRSNSKFQALLQKMTVDPEHSYHPKALDLQKALGD